MPPFRASCAEQRASVEIRPEDEKRNGEPDPARHAPILVAEQRDEHREERERVQLGPRHEERRRHRDDAGRDHGSSGPLACARAAQVEGER